MSTNGVRGPEFYCPQHGLRKGRGCSDCESEDWLEAPLTTDEAAAVQAADAETGLPWDMLPGSRVKVAAQWSPSCGLLATVVDVLYGDSGVVGVMVQFDGDPRPCRYGVGELEVVG